MAGRVSTGNPDWVTIHGLLSLAVYGGRIDNTQDERLLGAYLQQYFSSAMLSPNARSTMRLAPGVTLPTSSRHAEYTQIIGSLPAQDPHVVVVVVALPAQDPHVVVTVDTWHARDEWVGGVVVVVALPAQDLHVVVVVVVVVSAHVWRVVPLWLSHLTHSIAPRAGRADPLRLTAECRPRSAGR